MARKSVDQANPRDLNSFLQDMQKFQERKSINLSKIKEELENRNNVEVALGQSLMDDLSAQIVEMMEDRKVVDTKTRLYTYGQEKLRAKANFESSQKLADKIHGMFKP